MDSKQKEKVPEKNQISQIHSVLTTFQNKRLYKNISVKQFLLLLSPCKNLNSLTKILLQTANYFQWQKMKDFRHLMTHNSFSKMLLKNRFQNQGLLCMKRLMILSNVLLLYPVHQTGEYAETSRAFFKIKKASWIAGNKQRRPFPYSSPAKANYVAYRILCNYFIMQLHECHVVHSNKVKQQLLHMKEAV